VNSDICLGRLTMREAQALCARRGYRISLPGIRHIIKWNADIFVESSRTKKGAPFVVEKELVEYLNLNPHYASMEGSCTILEICKIFGVPKSTVYSAIKNGQLSYFRNGRGKGIMYVGRDAAEHFCSQYKARHNGR